MLQHSRVFLALLLAMSAGPAMAAPRADYYGTLEPFAADAVYFVVTDRFVNGDPGNDHRDQGGGHPTFDIPVHCPDGIDGKSFFQWNVPVGMPPWIRTLMMSEVGEGEDVVPLSTPSGRASVPPPSRVPPSSKSPKRVFLVDDPATLVYIANLGCIPLHVLASRAPDLSRADFFTLDFDVLMRISAMLGIHQALGILFAEERLGVDWLRTPHNATVFGGQSPLALATSGTQDGLLTVRRFLDGARGGLYMQPNAIDEAFTPYDETEIVFR